MQLGSPAFVRYADNSGLRGEVSFNSRLLRILNALGKGVFQIEPELRIGTKTKPRLS